MNYYISINSQTIGNPYVYYIDKYITLQEHEELNIEGDFEIIYSLTLPITPTIQQVAQELFGSISLI